MKILFVSSGNGAFGISPIIKNQGGSLDNFGVEVSYFPIIGKGIISYIKHIYLLKKHLSNNKYDVIHAHYSFSAFVAALANAKPLVVSLMGSDVYSSYLSKLCIKIFHRFSWGYTIVKSDDMINSLGLDNMFSIPNGVDTDAFNSANKRDCQKCLGWDCDKRHILFAANPLRPVKNYALANRALSIHHDKNTEIHSLIDISPEQMPIWINSADIILLVSKWEGSPNVIKEAMACNRPIIATNVGDIGWLLGRTPGCYITSSDPKDVAEKIKMALEFSERNNQTKGRDRIIRLGLDLESIANRIFSVYELVLKKNTKQK